MYNSGEARKQATVTLATISLLKKKIVEKCHRVDQNHKWNQNFFGFFAQNKKRNDEINSAIDKFFYPDFVGKFI